MIAVLASGKGSTLDNLCQHMTIDLAIISNDKSLPIVQKHNLNYKITSPERALDSCYEMDLIVLAGWNFLVPYSKIWDKRIINIHPSLLPKYGGKGFYGLKVHQAVLDAKEAESGCTVHWVNEDYDSGEIIASKKVPVLPDDTPLTLQARVQVAERELYPIVVKSLIKVVPKNA